MGGWQAAQASLSATIGAVVASGPAGVGSATNATITYSPPGFNPTYATWELTAVSNSVNAILNVAAGYPLDHPVLVVNNYGASQLPASIAAGAGLTNAGINYFASVDTGGHRLWITVNRLVTNSLNLVVQFSTPAAQPAPVISSFSPASGAAGTAVLITGQNFTNATAVAFNGVAAAFNVVSAAQISATVPAAATSGTISVTTPGGTAQSTGTFAVVSLATNLVIYGDSLVNGFADYSWATNVNDYNTSPVYSGSDSIRVTAAPYTALSLFHANFNTAPYASLSFWINGGPAGTAGLQVMGVTNEAASQFYATIYNLPSLAPNTWTPFNIPLAALGVANNTNCQGFWFWPTLAGATTFYVDSIQLNASAAPTLTIAPSFSKNGLIVLQLGGLSGQSYWLQTSTNLLSWTTIATNLLSTASVNFTNTVGSGSSRQFRRAVLPR